MTEQDEKKNFSNKSLLLKYSSLGAQLLAGLIIAVIAGKWIDGKLNFAFPVCIWLFPLIVILGMIFTAVQDTSKKKK